MSKKRKLPPPPPRKAARLVARKVRFRLDVYDKSRHQYRPLALKRAIVPLETTRLNAPLWRAFMKWLETGDWKKEIRPDEMGGGGDE